MVHMKKEKRKSGISVVGDVPWGTHLCQFYKTKEDLLDILVPYFKAGLENNESCMWVTSEPLSVEDAERELKKIVKNLDDYINKGQLEILDYSEWYTKNRKFDSRRVLEGWVEKEKYALQNGFDGLRLTGNTFWLGKNDWDDFKSYEETVNDVIDKHRMIAICSYSLEKCKPSEIIDVVSNHQFAIIKRESKWNIIESSERKKVEILNEKTILYETLVNISPDAITVTNLEGRITYLSPQTLKLLVYDRAEELLGHNAFEFIAPEDHEKAKIALQQTFVDSGIHNFECTAVRKDGTRIILEENTVIIRDSMGNPKSFMAIARDITDRKKAEETVRESEKRINAMMNSITESIFLMDVHGIILAANNTLANRLGTSIEKLKGSCIYDHLPTDVQKRRKEQVAEVIRTGKSVHFGDVRFDRNMDCIFYPLFDSKGRVSEIAVFAQDITERKRTEESLRFDSEILANLVEGINLVRADDGVIVYANRQFEKMFGYDSGELIKKPISIVNAPTDISPEETAKVIMDSLNKNGVWSGEIYNIKKDGTPFWCYVNVSKFMHTDYGVVWISVHQDITERKKAEENLRQSEEKFRILFDSSPYLIVETDEKGNFLALNQTMAKSLGSPAKKLIGKNIFDVIPGEIAEERATIARKALKEMKNQETYDGRAGRHFHNIYVPILHPDGNKTIQTIVRDITEQRKAEVALRESEEKYRTLIENADDQIFLIDKTLKVLSLNTSAARTFGKKPEEVVGKSILDLFPKEIANGYSEDLIKVFKTGEKYKSETKLITGEIKAWISVNLNPVKDQYGKVVSVLGVARDITERKRTEEMLQESEGLLRGLFENMTSGAAIYKVINDGSKGSDYIIRDFNVASLRIEGKRKDEVIGKSLFDLRPNIDQYGLIPIFQKVWRTGEPGYFPSTIYVDEKYCNWYENRVFKLPTGEIVAIYDDVTEHKKAEEEIKSLAKFPSEDPNPVLRITKDGEVVYSNKAGFEILDFWKTNIGENIPEHWCNIIRKRFTSKNLKAEEEEEVNDKIFSFVVVPVADEGYVNLYGRDITERKQAEEKIRGLLDSVAQERDRLSSLVNSITDEVWFADAQKNFTLANPAALREFGYSSANPINVEELARSLNVYRPDGSPRPVEEAPPLRALRGEVVQNMEEIVRTPVKGELRYRQVNAAPVRDVSGNIIGSVSVVRDITERKRMEDVLRENEEKYRGLIQNSKDSIAVIDMKGNVMFANKATEKLTGYTLSEGMGMSVKKITPLKYWPKSYQALQKAKKGEAIRYFESVIKRKDGKLIQVETGGQPILNDGKVVGIQIITRNITERKNAEEKIKRQNIQLKKLDHIKTDFLNTTSHELRTPVASIKGYIQMLLKQTLGEISEEQKKALEVILRNTNRLDHLIQDILDISRLESGTMKFVTEKTDVTKMVKEIAETMQASADLKGIKINIDIQKEIPDLMIDSERIKQVLMNLVDNAIKFSPDGSMIHIKARKEKEDVMFEVQDYGRGIPKNKQKKIFERFYQVDTGMDRKFGGVGLGLTISQGIIQAHGGKIWVDSMLGKGSTFKFSLPSQSVKDAENRFKKEIDIFELEK